MARDKFSFKVSLNGKLWYEMNENGKIEWLLPKDIPEREKILDNIGAGMSRHVNANPNSSLWTN